MKSPRIQILNQSLRDMLDSTKERLKDYNEVDTISDSTALGIALSFFMKKHQSFKEKNKEN